MPSGVRAAARRVQAMPWPSILRRELPQVARIVLVAATSWHACILLGATQPPVFAVVVPLATLRDDPFSAFNLSIARLVGVIAGLLIAIAVLHVLHPTTVAVACVLSAALLVGVVLRVGNVLNTQVAISALLVFSSANATGYAVTRLWETGVGTAVTLVLAPLLFPADPLSAARTELDRVAAALVDALRSSTAVVGEGRTEDPGQKGVLLGLLDDLDAVNSTLQRSAIQIATAGRSARWAILRRPALRATADLEPTRALAVRLNRQLVLFVEEVIAFAGRPAVGRDVTLRPDRLDAVVRPLQRCVRAALAGRPFAGDLASARAAVVEFRSQDHTPLASVLRRPLHRMVEELAAFGAGAR